jgi:hypothetical protein
MADAGCGAISYGIYQPGKIGAGIWWTAFASVSQIPNIRVCLRGKITRISVVSGFIQLENYF